MTIVGNGDIVFECQGCGKVYRGRVDGGGYDIHCADCGIEAKGVKVTENGDRLWITNGDGGLPRFTARWKIERRSA